MDPNNFQPPIVTPPPNVEPRRLPRPLVIGVSIVLVLVVLVAGFFVLNRSSKGPVSGPSVTAAPDFGEAYSLYFQEVGGTANSRVLAVMMKPAQRLPNAYNLEISFDASKVNVLYVGYGAIWEQANVLQNKIDQGKILLVAGQGFGTKHTSSFELARIEFSASGQNINFAFLPTTKLGFVGEDQLIAVTTQPITLPR